MEAVRGHMRAMRRNIAGSLERKKEGKCERGKEEEIQEEGERMSYW